MTDEAQPPMHLTDFRSLLAKQHFPKEWAKAITLTGKVASKKRQQLRARAEQRVTYLRLQSEGKSCASCDSFCSEGPCGSHCLRDTDFYGYALTKETSLCSFWRAKGTKP